MSRGVYALATIRIAAPESRGRLRAVVEWHVRSGFLCVRDPRRSTARSTHIRCRDLNEALGVAERIWQADGAADYQPLAGPGREGYHNRTDE